MRQITDLRPYQQRAHRFVVDTPRCALFLDMGMGKTAAVLTAIVDTINTFAVRRWLIVAPLRVAKTTWPDEIQEWAHTQGLTFQNAAGKTVEQRKIAVDTPSDVLLINRENVVWLEEYLIQVSKRGGCLPFDAIAIDESSSFKSRNTRRWRSMRRLSRLVERMVLMTGTPTPNSLLEIHPQMLLLDGGQRLGTTVNGFKEAYFTPVDREQRKWVLKSKQHADHIYKRLDDVCLTMLSEDYITLPDRIDQTVQVEMPPTSMDVYTEMEKTQLATLLNGDKVIAMTASVVVSKLLQIANGFLYQTDEDTGDRAVHQIHTAKLEALREIVDEANGMPVLVAYTFIADAEAIMAAFPEAEMFGKRDDDIARWNRREIPILLTHPKSAGHGLNLQFGGNIVVWYGVTFSLEEYQQLNKRIHRSGQAEKTVVVKHIIAAGTIDSTVLDVLRRKDAGQRHLLDALKKKAEEVIRG